MSLQTNERILVRIQLFTIFGHFSCFFLQYFQDTTGVDVTQYSGYEVLEVRSSIIFVLNGAFDSSATKKTQINGLNAVQYFEDYANHSIGLSKDFGARFNEAFTSPEPRSDICMLFSSLHLNTFTLVCFHSLL